MRTTRRNFLEIAGLVGGGVMLRNSLLGTAHAAGAKAQAHPRRRYALHRRWDMFRRRGSTGSRPVR